MAIQAKRRKNENVGSFIFRFNKKVKHSSILKEVKRRRFRSRVQNVGKRRKAALYRIRKQSELQRLKKYGS